MYPNNDLRWLLGKDMSGAPDDFTGTVAEALARVCPNWRVVSVGVYEEFSPHPLPGMWHSYILHRRRFGWHPEDIWIVKPVFISHPADHKTHYRPGWNDMSLTTRRERLASPVPPYFAVDTGLEDLLSEILDTILGARDSVNAMSKAACAAVLGFLSCDTSNDPDLAGIQTLLALGGLNGLVDTARHGVTRTTRMR